MLGLGGRRDSSLLLEPGTLRQPSRSANFMEEARATLLRQQREREEEERAVPIEKQVGKTMGSGPLSVCFLRVCCVCVRVWVCAWAASTSCSGAPAVGAGGCESVLVSCDQENAWTHSDTKSIK